MLIFFLLFSPAWSWGCDLLETLGKPQALEGTAGNCSVSYLLRSGLVPSCPAVGLASGKATVLHATLESLPEQLREEVNNHVPLPQHYTPRDPPSCLSLCITTLIPHDYISRKGWLVCVAYGLKHSLFNLTNELWMRSLPPSNKYLWHCDAEQML